MKIGINCQSFVRRRYTGIGRYAYHLVQGLSKIDKDNEYRLYARKNLFHFHKNIPRFQASNFFPCVDYFSRGPANILGPVDLYHVPSPGSLDAPRGAKIVLTVHDLIFRAFPKGHTPETIETGERELNEIKARAAKIICCSQSTIQDLAKYFQVPFEKTALVYQGVDKDIFYRVKGEEERQAARVVQAAGIDGPFIFSVGTIEPRKNVTGLFHALRVLKDQYGFRGKLVVAGMKGWLQDDVEAMIHGLDLTKDVIFLGFLSDAHLRFFYNRADVFAFPSFYEGFGFPIVEAFCCGAPVVTSNVSSCPEVAAGAALTVAPDRPEGIAAAIDRIMRDPGLRESLRQKGFARSMDFDPQRMARETLAVYKGVCG